MELLDVAPKSINQYLSTFIATYRNLEGNLKEYEIITRDTELTKDKLCEKHIDGVGIIAFDKSKKRILLLREFRLACNEWVYNFPGGLIDDGETPIMAAKRELKEETGLDLLHISRELPPSYTAVGISNETVVTIMGIADGTFEKSTSPDEEIEAAWYTKEQIRELFKNEHPMGLRTQSFLFMWAFG